LSRPELREARKKRVSLEVTASEIVQDNKKVIGEKDVTINKYIDLLAAERQTNEELRAQVNTEREEKKSLKSKFLSEKREYQKELQLEYETQQQKTERKCKKKLEQLETAAARELADVERHYSISLQTLEARTRLQEYEYKASFRQCCQNRTNNMKRHSLRKQSLRDRPLRRGKKLKRWSRS